MRPLGGCRVRLTELEIVIIRQFFTRADVAAGFNKDAVVFVLDFAVRRARMVDPAGGIAAPGGIDDDLIINSKEHGVGRVRVRFGIAGVRLFVRDTLAGIFDQPGSLRNQRERKYAAAMDDGPTDPESSPGFSLR